MGDEKKQVLYAYDVAGIWGRHRFTAEVEAFFKTNPDGHYVLARWDIDHFKLFNDSFGTEAGDKLLNEIGNHYMRLLNLEDIHRPLYFGHWGADHFVALYHEEGLDPDMLYRYTHHILNSYGYNFDFNVNYGFYRVEDPSLSVSFMCDQASLALRKIKKQYNVHYEWYNDSMRNKLLEEQEITSSMKKALKRGEFVPYFQPQYNYESGALIGAEALVRWISPVNGIIPPVKFVPLFEQNGFITEVDYHIWNCTCGYIRRWLDAGYKVPPVSVNISRRDLYIPDLVEKFIDLTDRYSLSHEMLRLEITESVYMDNPDQLISVVKSLQQNGFLVEMDDFGSGYSSLNTLKDVPVDMLKLDMKFMAQSANSERGGNILSSVVNMAHRINLPVLAEGVETKQQADYLKTINCLFMQGYLFSKPMPAAEYERLLVSQKAGIAPQMNFTKAIDNSIDFLDGSTQATLLFNSFVGGASIIEYENDTVRSLRENDRFLEELRVSREFFKHESSKILDHFDSPSRKVFVDAIKLAISTNDESDCTVHILPSKEAPDQWLHVQLRYLGSRFNCHILYTSIDNITSRKLLEKALFKEKVCLEQILRYAPGGMAEFIVENDSLTRIFISPVAIDILGYTGSIKPASTMSSQLRKVHPDDKKLYKDTILTAVKNKSEFSVTVRIILANGSTRWINLSANPAMLDKDLHYFGLYTDVTKHVVDTMSGKDAFVNNILSETGNDTILFGAWDEYCKNTDDLVFIKDVYSNYIKVSDSFAALTRAGSAEEAIGKTDYDLFYDKEIATNFINDDLAILSTGESRKNYIEATNFSGIGSHQLCQTSKFPIRNAQGEIIGIYGYSRNITSEYAFTEYKRSLEASGKKVLRYSVSDRAFHTTEREDGSIEPISIVDGPAFAVKKGEIVAESVDNWLAFFDAIDAGQRNGTADIRAYNKEGVPVWYRVEFNSIFDRDGKPLSAVISFKDVDSEYKLESEKEIEKACVYGSITALYPSYTATNLTQNTAKALRGYPSGMPGIENCQSYDEAVETIASFCVGKDAKVFRQSFERGNLIKNYESGRDMVSVFVDMKFPDGKIHKMECLAIKINDPIGSDILSTGLMREVG